MCCKDKKVVAPLGERLVVLAWFILNFPLIIVRRRTSGSKARVCANVSLCFFSQRFRSLSTERHNTILELYGFLSRLQNALFSLLGYFSGRWSTCTHTLKHWNVFSCYYSLLVYSQMPLAIGKSCGGGARKDQWVVTHNKLFGVLALKHKWK